MAVFTLTAGDGHPVACYAWVPREPVALVQVAHGMERLDCKLYPGGRHEMFNETNKDEVARDLINWLEENLP